MTMTKTATLDRRAALAGLATGALLATPRAAEAAGNDVELLALGREFEAAWARERAILEVAKGEDLMDEASEANQATRATKALVMRIHAVPATTLDGFRVKARTINWCWGDETEIIKDGDFGETIDVVVAAGIVRNLLALGGV